MFKWKLLNNFLNGEYLCPSKVLLYWDTGKPTSASQGVSSCEPTSCELRAKSCELRAYYNTNQRVVSLSHRALPAFKLTIYKTTSRPK